MAIVGIGANWESAQGCESHADPVNQSLMHPASSPSPQEPQGRNSRIFSTQLSLGQVIIDSRNHTDLLQIYIDSLYLLLPSQRLSLERPETELTRTATGVGLVGTGRTLDGEGGGRERPTEDPGSLATNQTDSTRIPSPSSRRSLQPTVPPDRSACRSPGSFPSRAFGEIGFRPKAWVIRSLCHEFYL